MLVVQQNDMTFIVVNKQDNFDSNKIGYVCTVNEEIYNKLKPIVDCFSMPVNNLYWEQDYHDKFVSLLSTMIPQYSKKDISTALSSLGY